MAQPPLAKLFGAAAREEADVGKLASSDKWALTEADENQRV